MNRSIAALGQRVAPELATDGRGDPTKLPADRAQAQTFNPQDRDLLSFGQAQMFVLCHRQRPDRWFPNQGVTTPRDVALALKPG